MFRECDGAWVERDDNRGIFLGYSMGELDFLDSSSVSERVIGALAGAREVWPCLKRPGLD